MHRVRTVEEEEVLVAALSFWGSIIKSLMMPSKHSTRFSHNTIPSLLA